MDLDEYQKAAHTTSQTSDIEVYVLGLIGEAGSIASAVKKARRDSPAKEQVLSEVSAEIGDALWYVAELATRHDLSLSKIAEDNLEKTGHLFRASGKPRFDEDFPETQRFPDQFSVEFNDDGRELSLIVDGHPFGNSLTDNSYADDGYRYHDAFHFAYVAILGWSPVVRGLWKRKRRADSKVDEVEDGARAAVLEEGISILVFSQSSPDANGHCLFSDPAMIPFWLLENIKKMTDGLEVGVRSVDEWRRAISHGFQAFQFLRDHRGGRMVCSVSDQTIRCEPPPGYVMELK